MRRWFAVVAGLLLATPALAGSVPVDDPRWEIEAEDHAVEQRAGRQAMRLRNGRAMLAVPFADGTIEFDILVDREQGYSGVQWRTVSPGNHEEFYIRPHQSGNPDANQYQPVFHGVAGWQIYHGTEYAAPVEYRFGEWMRIRIDVAGDRARIFLDGEPILLVNDLHGNFGAGGLGLFSGFAPAWFSEFRYENSAVPEIPPGASESPELPEGLVMRWEVSDAVGEDELLGETALPEGRLDALAWHTLDVEPNGVANLARVQGREAGNTAFVRLRLESEVARIQEIRFGFSDRVRIYHNRRLIYSGADRWRSRDYRFLGTVGLYSSVFCALEPGENEIVLAVSEDFGGWAVEAAFVPEPGVRRINP